MRRIVLLSFAIAIFALWAGAMGSSWNKIRYMGGTVQAKVNPYNYNTTLTVSPDSIVLVIGSRQTVRLKPSQVRTLSYGQEAQRRVAAVVSLSNPNPPALFGMLRAKDHYIGIVYQTDDGQIAAVLLEAHKLYYLDILAALKMVTGKPVEIEK